MIVITKMFNVFLKHSWYTECLYNQEPKIHLQFLDLTLQMLKNQLLP
jgi:hypothetical protein